MTNSVYITKILNTSSLEMSFTSEELTPSYIIDSLMKRHNGSSMIVIMALAVTISLIWPLLKISFG
jgi:hypothetical protein